MEEEQETYKEELPDSSPAFNLASCEYNTCQLLLIWKTQLKFN